MRSQFGRVDRHCGTLGIQYMYFVDTLIRHLETPKRWARYWSLSERKMKPGRPPMYRGCPAFFCIQTLRTKEEKVPASSSYYSVLWHGRTRPTEQKKLFQARCFVSFDNILIFTSRKGTSEDDIPFSFEFSQLKCFLENGDDLCPNMLEIKSPGIDTDFFYCLSLVKRSRQDTKP